jgi:17beta-estradiol 17-dehydrogenase / very-long-chain 3-oxoacyl-CoA reductase
VAGASDGIGKAFAFKLASMDYNLILLGRNSEKLEKVT